MIAHTVDLLDKLKIKDKIVVVGFAKESVINVLGERVNYVVQEKRLGTANAVACALKTLNKKVRDVLILQGDDSALYKTETIKKIIKSHVSSKTSFTLLTIDVANPFGLGRIIRDQHGKLNRITEEKSATDNEKKIKEINPACYLISVDFLNKYLKKIKKDNATGEYYLTHLVDVAVASGEEINVVKGGKMQWRGINTLQELEEAQKMFKETKN